MPRERRDGEVQPLIAISGGSGTSVNQPIEEVWEVSDADTGFFQIDTVYMTATTPTFKIQTATALDDRFFVDVTGGSFAPDPATPKTLIVLPSAGTPIMRYLRWRIVGPGSDWTMQFRIYATFKKS